MRKSFSFVLFAAGALLTGNVFAQSTTVGFENGDQLLYTNITKTTPLTPGVAATGGDGAVIRLGYYSAGTNASPFGGDFVTLAGFGAANTGAISGVTTMYPNVTYQNIRIGDAPNNVAGAEAGAFALTLNFAPANQNTNKNLPAAGVPLVIQFYNNTTIGTSTFYNAVSNAAWDWQAPSTTAQVLISLNDPNLQWLGGATSAFYTSQLNVPEPSTYALALGGITGLVVFSRRWRAAA